MLRVLVAGPSYPWLLLHLDLSHMDASLYVVAFSATVSLVAGAEISFCSIMLGCYGWLLILPCCAVSFLPISCPDVRYVADASLEVDAGIYC